MIHFSEKVKLINALGIYAFKMAQRLQIKEIEASPGLLLSFLEEQGLLNETALHNFCDQLTVDGFPKEVTKE